MSASDIAKKGYSSFIHSLLLEYSSPEDLMVKAYIELKKWIFFQRIVPGQKLIYQDLADKLKMSKTPIIYALTRLEYEGFVKRHLNRGYFVHEMDQKEADELFDARQAIEVFSLEAAIKNATKKDLKELEHMINQHCKTEYTNMRKRLILDVSLHLKITELTGNTYLRRMLQMLFERLYLTYRFERLASHRKDGSEKEHGELLNAIKNKDSNKAKTVLQSHIINGKEGIIEGLLDFFPKSASK